MNDKRKKVLLIYPSQFYCPDQFTFPMIIKTQLVKLYSHLVKLNCDVQILDFELEFGRPIDAQEINNFILKVYARLESLGSADIIGISCYTSLNYGSTITLVSIIKKIFPKSMIVIGGYHCLADKSDFLKHSDIDFIVRGCGIRFFDALILGRSIQRMCTFSKDSADPDLMLYKDYPYIDQVNPLAVNLQLSQGCPFTCEFCSEPFLHNNSYNSCSIDKALNSINNVIKVYNPAKIVIKDMIFGLNDKWQYGLLEKLIQYKYSQIFWFNFRVDTISEKTIELLSQFNSDITIGVESLSSHTLMNMNKTKSPKQYIDKFHKIVKWVNKYRVPTTFTIILNFPGETVQSYNETMNNITKAQDVSTSSSFKFDFLEYQCFPGNYTYCYLPYYKLKYGTEVLDRRWYSRKECNILDFSYCSIPSLSLVKQIGIENVRCYFSKQIETINRNTKENSTIRLTFIRSWRFVESVKKTIPEFEKIDFYNPDSSHANITHAKKMIELLNVHESHYQKKTAELTILSEDTWWNRNKIWNQLIDNIQSQNTI